MNYSVHAVMYGYYCLMALRLKPAWLPPVAITLCQLSQMVVGVAVQAAAMRLHVVAPESCPHLHTQNLVAGALMYGSYFVLFFKFLVERFARPAAAARGARPSKAKSLPSPGIRQSARARRQTESYVPGEGGGLASAKKKAA